MTDLTPQELAALIQDARKWEDQMPSSFSATKLILLNLASALESLQQRNVELEAENAELKREHLTAAELKDINDRAELAGVQQAQIARLEKEIKDHANWAKEFAADPKNSVIVRLFKIEAAAKLLYQDGRWFAPTDEFIAALRSALESK